MKRDMDLIRKIAFHIESAAPPILSDRIPIDGYSQEQIGYHCDLMKDAGLVHLDDESPGGNHPEFITWTIQRLSWSGHEFIDAARDDTVWNKVTGHVKETAKSVTFDALTNLLKRASQQAVAHGIDWLSKTDWQWLQNLPLQ